MPGQLNFFCGCSSFLTKEQKRTSTAQCYLPSRNYLLPPGLFNALVCTLALILLAPHVKGEDGELCVVSPLQTPYLISYGEEPSPCKGCILDTPPSAAPVPSTDPSQYSQVHVLQSDRPEDGYAEVTFTSSAADLEGLKDVGKTRLAFVLSSDAASSTTFVISFEEPELLQFYAFHIVMAGDVKVAVASQAMEYTSERRSSWTSKDVFTSSKKHFGFVTSFTRGSTANLISFNLDSSGMGESTSCSDATTQLSPLASCKTASRQPISGCYHEDMIGVQERDIHIIEVDGTANASRSILLLVTGAAFSDDEVAKDPLSGNILPSSSSGQPNEKEAVASFGVPRGIKEIVPLRRNLTIALRSSRPTTWTLRVSNIQGIISLFVGDGDQVENTSSPGQNLSISMKRFNLLKTFDGLFLQVLKSFGAPISYTKAKTPNLIRMVVPQRHEERQTLFEPPQENSLYVLGREKAFALVKESVSVVCLENSAYISLPLEVLEKIGGAEMFFNDRSCMATRNSTHMTISSRYSHCGFSKQRLDQNTDLYTNFVHIEIIRNPHHFTSDDEDDYEGSAYGHEDSFGGEKMPVELVQCKSTSRAPLHEELSGGGLGSEYRLQVFHDSKFNNPYKRTEFPIAVPLETMMHARLAFWQDNYHITSDSGIRLMIEECLLSKSATLLLNPVTLIRKSCSVQPYVAMEGQLQSNDVAFHFQISNEYAVMEKIYLHCQVGVCSDGVLPKPSVKKCVNPGIYCGKETLMNIFTNQPIGSLLKTVIAGPFIKHPSNKVHSGASVYAAGDGDNQQARRVFGSEDATQIVVMEGLSTEIVVGIAIAAFVIGVCLMATLWGIYMKTDPHHQMRPKANVPRNCGYDLSGHSGSSTPSSQAPMTA